MVLFRVGGRYEVQDWWTVGVDLAAGRIWSCWKVDFWLRWTLGLRGPGLVEGRLTWVAVKGLDLSDHDMDI